MISERIVEIQNLFKEIEIQLGVDLEVAHELIEQYGKLVQDARYFSLKSTLCFYQGEINKGIDILKEGLKKHSFNFDIHYNLGFLYGEIKDYLNAIKHYLFSAKYSNNIDDKKSADENVERLLKEFALTDVMFKKEKIAEIVKKVNVQDGRMYPLDLNGESLIRRIIKYESEKSYLVNMYQSFQVTNINKESKFYFKTELINGEQVEAHYTYNSDAPFVLPLSLTEDDTVIKVTYNNKIVDFEENTLPINKYNYLKFNEPGELVIETNKSIFIGIPILLKIRKDKPKLVMKIFVDGLAYDVLEEEGLKNIMPNTAAFFKNGFNAGNCIINSEWTLPSKASINTGTYPTKHRLLHPEYHYSFEEHNKLMAEYFKEAGFYTARFDTNWRTTAGFGYYKGVDRLVYESFHGGMDCRDVVTEAIEHISSFKDTNNYINLSMMDLHNVPDEIESHLFSEVNTDITMKRNKRQKGSTSVLTKYDEVKIYKYKQEIKRIDIFLGILFGFIQKNYDKSEYLVVLHSDHGQTFLNKEGTLYHNNRIKVPFMMQGKDVPSANVYEIIETVDILPSLLAYSNIEVPKGIDGKLPKALGGTIERDYAFTQIIHPNQPYKAIITEKDFTFILETKENVDNNLTISFSEYSTKYINKNTKEDVSIQYLEKVEFFESYIYSNIKEFIR
ncbi:sulfatase-like hydrolase/transferase [Lysinibacillus parviboronicapiens]|uniref:sulfatase-like hydrolase/transferase n=1 Tax=Lysinibacillus parviboronicapiens TaxID=436516 RepID=UPI000D36A9C3|nr:sulfatase-like hydrolase/transferase [Lysinibacillus parviboronicapiens]